MDNRDLEEDRFSVPEQGYIRLPNGPTFRTTADNNGHIQNIDAHAMPELDEDAEHPFQCARVRTQSEESGIHTPIEENSPFGSPSDDSSIHREECVTSNTSPIKDAERVESSCRIRLADPYQGPEPIDTRGTCTYGPSEERLSISYPSDDRFDADNDGPIQNIGAQTMPEVDEDAEHPFQCARVRTQSEESVSHTPMEESSPSEDDNIFQTENILGDTPVGSGGNGVRDDEVNDGEDDEKEEQLQGIVLTDPVTTVADNATGGCQASAYVTLPCPELPCKKDMPPINVLTIPPLYPTFWHYRRQQQHSFDSWDEQNVSKDSMLRTNFFFTEEGDKVTCSICGGMLKNWKPGDDPRELHDSHFPRCGTQYYDEQYNQLLQFCIFVLYQLLLMQNA